MNLVPWHRGELDSLQQLQGETDHLKQRFFGEAERGGGRRGLLTWAPCVDVEEDDRQYVVKADLPGVDAKDVEVSVVDNTLVLRGQKKEEREEEKNYHRVERFEGQFYREIPLPRGIEVDKVQARSTNGVVTVTIPKKAGAQPRKITVHAEK